MHIIKELDRAGQGNEFENCNKIFFTNKYTTIKFNSQVLLTEGKRIDLATSDKKVGVESKLRDDDIQHNRISIAKYAPEVEILFVFCLEENLGDWKEKYNEFDNVTFLYPEDIVKFIKDKYKEYYFEETERIKKGLKMSLHWRSKGKGMLSETEIEQSSLIEEERWAMKEYHSFIIDYVFSLEYSKGCLTTPKDHAYSYLKIIENMIEYGSDIIEIPSKRHFLNCLGIIFIANPHIVEVSKTKNRHKIKYYNIVAPFSKQKIIRRKLKGKSLL